VQKGDTLATALARHPEAFDEVFVSLWNTGEVSGTLDQILDQTATYLERAEDLRLKVEAALRYPIFVLTFSMLVMVGMLLWVIPRFLGHLRTIQGAVAWPTLVLLTVSRTITQNLAVTLPARGGGRGGRLERPRAPRPGGCGSTGPSSSCPSSARSSGCTRSRSSPGPWAC